MRPVTGIAFGIFRFTAFKTDILNAVDADALQIKSGDEVKVTTRRGSLVIEAKVSDSVREKTLFIPVSERKVNYLANDLLDIHSKQPDYNHNAARITRAKEL